MSARNTLNKGSLQVFKKTRVQWETHSFHTTYSRGVSLLIHKTVQWESIWVKRDPAGRYVFVQARLYSFPFVIFCIYNPPPASMQVMKKVVMFMA